MGMAAGQARLLSITSRMSDNELRAQLINNDKMRLATKSAQVSEAYTTALNEAQLMFTNYDKDNNASYKDLTFNALTAYNQYNNQYAISNSAGQLLVSEKDAQNFKAANNDINKFLECYGLTQTTTYFENLEKYSGANVEYYSADKNGKYYINKGSNGVIYNSGELIDVEGVSKNIQIDSGLTPKALQAMYDGTEYNNVKYAGYMNIKASEYYYNYSSALANFNNAKENFETKASEISRDLFNSIKVNGKTIPDIKEKLTNANSKEEITGYLNDISEAITGKGGNVKPKSLMELSKKDTATDKSTSEYYESILKLINLAEKDTVSVTSGLSCSPDGTQINYSDFVLTKKGDKWTAQVYKEAETEDGKEELVNVDGEITPNADGTLSFKNGLDEYKNIPVPVLDPETNEYKMPEKYDFSITSDIEIEEYKAIALDVIKSLSNAIPNLFDTSQNYYKYQWKTDGDSIKWLPDGKETETVEYLAYKDAAKKLYETIFGSDNGFSDIKEANWGNLADNTKIESLGGKFKDEDKIAEFTKIKQVILLDEIMNTYGEPTYAWIDKSNPKSSYNENGSAKAQWYENLFNKMQKSGYKTLHDGLASSKEWMRFAFESGLVCLEQVDAENNWNTTTYTNCSDITEQSNNAAITKAEAEYNAAMAKIENKDKKYDLELKNIDTEHNSLQTEYESIKTAIDKNIERTFKIYS